MRSVFHSRSGRGEVGEQLGSAFAQGQPADAALEELATQVPSRVDEPPPYAEPPGEPLVVSQAPAGLTVEHVPSAGLAPCLR